jgi:hypothetical protein
MVEQTVPVVSVSALRERALAAAGVRGTFANLIDGGRYGPMRGFKCPRSPGEFCRAYDELRNFLRPRSRTNQHVSADYRRFHCLRRTATILSLLQAA